MKKAFKVSLPIMISYLFLSMTYGLMMEKQGFAFYYSLIISMLIYTGAYQFVFISMISHPISLIEVTLTALFMNARNGFYVLSLAKDFSLLKSKAIYLVHTLGDETFAADHLLKKEGKDAHTMIYVHFFARLSWMIGCIIGGVLGSVIPLSLEGIDFSMTCMFLTIFIDQFQNKHNRKIQYLSLLIGIICLLIFKSQFMIIALIIITIILYIGENDE